MGALALTVPLVKLGAIAAGSAYGSRVMGLSGAAARSAGLAKIAGGALSTGGGGVAGGMLRLRAVGTSLIARQSWQVSNAYFADLVGDLRIDLLKEGRDPALICIDGFLTETGADESTEADANSWLNGLAPHYSGHAIYRVRWPSKRKSNIVVAALKGFVGSALPASVGAARVARNKSADRRVHKRREVFGASVGHAATARRVMHRDLASAFAA